MNPGETKLDLIASKLGKSRAVFAGSRLFIGSDKECMDYASTITAVSTIALDLSRQRHERLGNRIKIRFVRQRQKDEGSKSWFRCSSGSRTID